jgi:hypothetical protein
MTLKSARPYVRSVDVRKLMLISILVPISLLLLSACTQGRTSGGSDLIYPDRSGTNYDTALLNSSHGTNIFRPHLLSMPKGPVYAKND